MTLRGLKELVYEANMELPRRGLVSGTFGNVSGIDRDKGLVAIKPSGVSYDVLTPDDIVIVDLDNTVVEGDKRPSSDTKTHTVLYRRFPSIGGVAHTHSTHATAWAQAKRPIPCFGTTHADSAPGDIPVTRDMKEAEIAGDYETETGRVIAELFADRSPEEITMALVASHGPFTWGATPMASVENSAMLEEIARMALHTLMIAPDAGAIGDALHNRHFSRKHGAGSYYGQEETESKG